MGHRGARFACLACMVLMGCGESAPESETPTLRVFNWWDEPEGRALEALIEYHQELHPDVDVNYGAIAPAERMHDQLKLNVLKGHPPQTFQANLGMDLLRWVTEYGDEPQVLRALDSEWLDDFPDPIRDSVSHEGTVYAVPLNIHRINTLYINQSVFEEAVQVLEERELLEDARQLRERPVLEPEHCNGSDADAYECLQDFLELCRLLERAGKDCLQLGIKADEYPLASIIFESLIFSQGAGYYQEFFSGRVPQDPLDGKLDGRLLEVLKSAVELLQYVNSGADLLEWSDAVERFSGVDPATNGEPAA